MIWGMAHALPLEDFRARRIVLDPPDFAVSNPEDSISPGDRIDSRIWHSLMTLPTDVSIKTSDEHGTMFDSLYDLWAMWGEALMPIIEEPHDAVLWAMRDVNRTGIIGEPVM